MSKEAIWSLWTDINHWHRWDDDIEYCKLTEAFAVGNHFTLKPKGAPAVKIQIVEIAPSQHWTDCTSFLGAKMYGSHEMRATPEGLHLTTTITVTGPLKWLWIKLVAQGIVAGMPKQMEALVQLARS